MKHSKWIAMLAMVGAVAGLASAQGKLTGVTTTKTAGGVEFHIKGSNLATPTVSRTKGNKSYTLQWNAHLVGKGARRSVNSHGVGYVWFGWYKNRPPQVRVQLWLTDPSVQPKLQKTESGWTVGIGATTTVAAATKKPASADPYAAFYENKEFKMLPSLTAPVRPEPKPTKPNGNSLNDTLSTMGFKPAPTVMERAVSLEFIHTDVNLILKALAAQADVNIVTSPDVTGKVSVKLDNVPLTDALNLVTTIAGVRYTKIGKTFIVTSSARFSDAIRQVIGKLEEAGETRVIQLSSGEGKQIKAAALKAIPQLSSEGFYDLILPTERISAKTSSGVGVQTGDGGAVAGAVTGGGASTTQANTTMVETNAESQGGEGKDAYILVVATAERLNEVVQFITELDKRIAVANSLTGAGMGTRVVPVYCPNPEVIADSIRNMVARGPRASAFKVVVSNGSVIGTEDAGKLIIITGPTADLDTLEHLARATDAGIANALGVSVPQTPDEARKNYEVVELRWVEPIEAAAELESRVRGLSARLMPAYVDPSVKGSRKIGDVQSSSSTTAQNGNEGGANPGQSSNAGQATSESKLNSNMEKNLGTEPMRLLLYGTTAQIVEAKRLLGAIDTEPHMMSIEMRVLDLSVDDAKRFGLDWGLLSNGFVKAINLTNLIVPAGAGGVGGSGSSRSTSFTFDAILDKLTTKNNLISRPNTIAIDGKPTSIFVGDTIRYAEQIQATQNGTTVIIGKVDVGVTLNVTARVGADGTIMMNLEPHLSILKGFTQIGEDGGQVPQTSERRLKSSVMLKSGDTIALGGLIQDQDRHIRSGFPILGDLPIIGALFRSETTQKVRSEVVFFITAKLLDKVDARKAPAVPGSGDKKN